MADKMVSFVGIVFDSRRNSEGDFDLNKCTLFGITKEVSKLMFAMSGSGRNSQPWQRVDGI